VLTKGNYGDANARDATELHSLHSCFRDVDGRGRPLGRCCNFAVYRYACTLNLRDGIRIARWHVKGERFPLNDDEEPQQLLARIHAMMRATPVGRIMLTPEHAAL
jgi:hypothetical protein